MSVSQKYGWRRQLPDFRDFKYAAPPHVLRALPPFVDLRPTCPPNIYDQTTIGSCTANGIGTGHQFGQIRQNLPPEGSSDAAVIAAAVAKTFVPSRLFIYWNERDMEGSVNEDAGAIIRDGMKSVAQQGVCDERVWPYDVRKFRDKPPEECYRQAMMHQVTSYHSVPQTLEQMKGCLAEGFPFVFGFSVYESFESEEVSSTGIMSMPSRNESLRGGHAVIAVGYDDAKQWFIVRNSWGAKWGDKGYFYMPYAYAANPGLADDFWTIRMVEDEDGPTPGPGPGPTPGPTPDPGPTPEPGPCDCSMAFPAVKQFLDATVVEMNKGLSIEQAMAEGLRATQVYMARVAGVRARRT